MVILRNTPGTTPMPFLGFPYLVVRIGHTPLRHHDVLPADWPEERLVDVARRQVEANQLDACLCLSRSEAIYVSPGTAPRRDDSLPLGHPITDHLVTAGPVPDSSELAARREALRTHVDRESFDGYLVGDGLEAGRPATVADMDRLAWPDRRTLPPGLRPCPECREARGEFLALDGQGNLDRTPRVIDVHCRCDNHNRCAGCSNPLADHRLSAYYWDPAERGVRYVAAYCGLSHRCG